MYVITVEFALKPGEEERFRARMMQQARDSLEQEAGCLQFDVCLDPEDPRRIFLYEVYQDEAAFQVHLGSPHFKNFDATVADWFERKDVHVWHLAG